MHNAYPLSTVVDSIPSQIPTEYYSLAMVPIPVSVFRTPSSTPRNHPNWSSSNTDTDLSIGTRNKIILSNTAQVSFSVPRVTDTCTHTVPVLKKDEYTSAMVQVNTIVLPLDIEKISSSSKSSSKNPNNHSPNVLSNESMDIQLHAWLQRLEPLLRIQHPSLLPCIGIDVLPTHKQGSHSKDSLTVQLYEPYPSLPSISSSIPHIETSVVNPASVLAPSKDTTLPTDPFVPEQQCKLIFQELVQILALLHSQSIVHGDLVTDHIYSDILTKIPSLYKSMMDTSAPSETISNSFPISESLVRVGGLCCSQRLQKFMPNLQLLSRSENLPSTSSPTVSSLPSLPFSKSTLPSSLPSTYSNPSINASYIPPGPKMDTWSLGVILLELLLGYRFLHKLPCPDNQLRSLEIHCDHRKLSLIEQEYKAWLKKKSTLPSSSSSFESSGNNASIVNPSTVESIHQPSTTIFPASSIPKFYRGTSFMQDMTAIAKGFSTANETFLNESKSMETMDSLSSAVLSSPESLVPSTDAFDLSLIDFSPIVSWYIEEANKIASVYSSEVEEPRISSILEYLSPDCLHFLDSCLQVDRYQRPTPTELLAHPWISLSHLLTPLHVNTDIDNSSFRGHVSQGNDNPTFFDTVEQTKDSTLVSISQPTPIAFGNSKLQSPLSSVSQVTGLSIDDHPGKEVDSPKQDSVIRNLSCLDTSSLMSSVHLNSLDSTKTPPLSPSLFSNVPSLRGNPISHHNLSSFHFRTPLFSTTGKVDDTLPERTTLSSLLPPDTYQPSSDTVFSKSFSMSGTSPLELTDILSTASSLAITNEVLSHSVGASGNFRKQDTVSNRDISSSVLNDGMNSSGALNVSVVKNFPNISGLAFSNEHSSDSKQGNDEWSRKKDSPNNNYDNQTPSQLQHYEGLLKEFARAFDSMSNIDSLFPSPSSISGKDTSVSSSNTPRSRSYSVDRHIQQYAAAYVDRLYRRSGTSMRPTDTFQLVSRTTGNHEYSELDSDPLVQTDGWFLHDPRLEMNQFVGNKVYEAQITALKKSKYNEVGLTIEQEMFLYNNDDESMNVPFLEQNNYEAPKELFDPSLRSNSFVSVTKNDILPNNAPVTLSSSIHMPTAINVTNGSNLSVITHLSPTVHENYPNTSIPVAASSSTINISEKNQTNTTNCSNTVPREFVVSSNVLNPPTNVNLSPVPYPHNTPLSSTEPTVSQQGFFSRLFSPFSSHRPTNVFVPKTEINSESPQRRNVYPRQLDSENEDRLLSTGIASTTHSLTLTTARSTTTVPILNSPPNTMFISPVSVVSNTNTVYHTQYINSTLTPLSNGSSSAPLPSSSTAGFFSRFFTSTKNKVQPV